MAELTFANKYFFLFKNKKQFRFNSNDVTKLTLRRKSEEDREGS